MKKCLFLMILMVFSFHCYSQVTITNISKKVEVEVLKPPDYDSLKKFVGYNSGYSQTTAELYYKQYIGLKIFFPPCTGHVQANLYTIKPSFIKLDKPAFTVSSPNKLDSIMTFVYKPVFIAIGGGSMYRNEIDGARAHFYTDCKNTGNKYYTIIDVRRRDTLSNWLNINYKHALKIRNYETDVQGRRIFLEYYFFNRFLESRDCGFLIKDDVTGDTLITDEGLPGILVPYFVKQKEMFDGKTFIALTSNSNDPNRNVDYIFKDIHTDKEVKIENGSKWKCEVTLLDYYKVNPKVYDNQNLQNLQDYHLSYIFKNDSNSIAIVDFNNHNHPIKMVPYIGVDNFTLLDIYNEKQEEKRLKEEELLAKIKRDKQIQLEKEKDTKAKHLQFCIYKFGQNLGEIIAQGKVKIGMTTEMCKTAWGVPFDKDMTTTSSGKTEYWYYGWKRRLYFVDGILTRIDE